MCVCVSVCKVSNNYYNVSGNLYGMRTIKLKTLLTNKALQHVKGIKAADPRYQDINCACKIQWYIIGILLIILLGMVYLVTNKIKKSNLFGGHLFSNVTKVNLFISNTHSYVPINICKIAAIIHFIQDKREINSRNYKIQEKLDLGYSGNKLERSQHDFKWK